MWKRKKITEFPAAPAIERDARVPHPELWAMDGISGRIGRGALAGLPVKAARDLEPNWADEEVFIFRLWLPEPKPWTLDVKTGETTIP